MNKSTCIGISIDQLMKELVMNRRCIGQWSQTQLYHSKIHGYQKTIVTLHHEEMETYRPQPRDLGLPRVLDLSLNTKLY